MIKKAKLEGTIYDVISEETFKKNPSIYVGYNNAVAIEKDGHVYPIRNTTVANTMVGYYPSSDSYVQPRNDTEEVLYGTGSIINFSDVKSFRELIEVIKRAITDKQIDLDKYGPRFGSNYPNEKRLLKKSDMTLQKGILYAGCLDFDIYVTIKDSSPEVPNPIGETITVKLTGEGAGYSEEEFVDEEQEVAAMPYHYNPNTIYPIVTCTYGMIEKKDAVMPIIFN